MTRINILHVGDLHIHKADLFEKDVVLEAFLLDIEKISKSGLKPDIITFSGDLVQGGDHIKDFELAFDHFIDPLCSKIGCSYERVFFTPGNHDLQRKVVEDQTTLIHGLDNNVIDQERLNKEVKRAECRSHIEKKFENYDSTIDLFGKKNLVQKDELFSSYYIPEIGLSVISVNTSWLSTGGLIREDKEKLVISDIVLQKAIASVPKDSKKLLLGHHPLEYLAEFNQQPIRNIIDRDCDLFLFGHMHESSPQYINSPQGKALFSQCGSLHSGNNRFNGYSIISIDRHNPHVEVNMRTYFPQRREFDSALNICKEGRFHSSEEARTYWTSHPGSIDASSLENWLKTKYVHALYQTFDIGFYKDSLSEVYVEPVISNQPENLKYKEDVKEEQKNISFYSAKELVQSNENYILYARKEYGKTSLLQKVAIECIESREGETLSVPFLINFKELKVGKNQIQKALKQSVHPAELPEQLNLDKILKLGMATIIIDDLHNKDTNKLNMLTKFMDEYKNNRFILCVEGAIYETLGAAWIPETPIKLNKLFLHCFSMEKLRMLVEKWNKKGDKKQNQKLLDKILHNIVQINVPRTPVIGSILLTILEQQADFAPINRAVMIERFVETLLEKHKPDEARRETFDYRNKEHYLSYLAGRMVKEECYSYSKNDLTKITIEYLENLALDENASDIINYFIRTRVFSESDGQVKFKYRSICEYFIAKQMSEDEEFKKKIIQSDDYLMFQNEIECLSGIKRNDVSLLNEIKNKFYELDDQVELGPQLEVFEKLNIRTESSRKLISSIEEDIKDGTLNDEERDALLETNFPKDVGHTQDMRRPVYNDFGHKWAAALALYSKVLKNTEIMTADQKKFFVLDVLQKWSGLTVYALAAVPILVEQKKIKINGQIYEIILPPNMTDDELFHALCLSAGLGVSAITKSVVSTEKLEPIFKSDLAAAVPLIVEFYQSLILLHMESDAAFERLDKTLKKITDSNYLMELALVELNHVLKVKHLTKEEAGKLMTMLGQTFANLRGGISGSQAQYVGDKYREKIHKRLLVQKQKNAQSAGLLEDKAEKKLGSI